MAGKRTNFVIRSNVNYQTPGQLSFMFDKITHTGTNGRAKNNFVIRSNVKYQTPGQLSFMFDKITHTGTNGRAKNQFRDQIKRQVSNTWSTIIHVRQDYAHRNQWQGKEPIS